MKKILAAFACLLTVTFGFADTVFLPSFAPVTPEVLTQGSSFTAISHGYNALFTNPAGFSRKGGSLTLLSIQADPYIPFGKFLQDLIKYSQNGTLTKFSPTSSDPDAVNMTKFFTDLLIKNGLGANINAGLGLVGGNLGLGAAIQTNIFAKGTTLLGTSATIDVTAGAVVGYSLPINLGITTLHLGLDVRPMVRYYGNMTVTDLLSQFMGVGTSTTNPLDSTKLKYGFGLGIDAGAMADLGPFTAAISLRDIGTRFDFKEYTINQIIKASGVPTGGTAPADTYIVPMTVAVGAAFHPDLGGLANLLDPKVHADVQIPVTDEFNQPSIWASSHLGGEVTLLRFINVRGGFNQGYFTLGLGAKLLFADVNIGAYAEELGRFIGENRRAGLTAEAAIRF